MIPPSISEPSSGPAPARRAHRLAFITGRGRSGTWLLQSALNRHPEIRLAPEGELLILLVRRYGDIDDWSRPVRVRFCRDLRRIPRLTTWWRLDLAGVERRVVDEGEGADLSDMCRILYACHAKAMGDPAEPTVLGEKNPGYALLIPALLRRFPDALVIHMVRDPRDNVLSFRSVEFDLDGVAALAERWRAYNEAALDAMEQWPERVHVVHFEDLVRQPQRTLEELCSFLGVEPHPALLTLGDDSVPTVLPWNRRIVSAPDPDRLERWTREMSPGHQRVVEARCGGLMERLGYSRHHGDIRPWGSLGVLPGALFGAAATALERVFPRLPLGVQLAILARYRGWDRSEPAGPSTLGVAP